GTRRLPATNPRSHLWSAGAGRTVIDVHEVAAVGPDGTVLAYAADTVHRGSDMTEPGAGRFFFNLAFRPAGADWIGALPWPRRGIEPAMAAWIQTLDPRQLTALGFPPPGQASWAAD